MAILVTGGAGYIGSHCVASLLEAGADVAVVDDLSKGHRAALKGGRLYVGNVGERAFLREVFQKESIEAVIHFAAYSLVGESMDVPERYFRNNVTAGLSLIETMIEFQVPYLVFSSTAATYGEPEHIPIVETDRQLPTNPYGESKLIVEHMLRWCDQAHGLKFCALRYFNVAGAWHDGSIGEDHRPETHLIPVILQVAQGKRERLSLYGADYPTRDGTCVRDYIHVMDLSEAHLLAADYLLSGGESDVFNLGNGVGFTVKEVIQAAEEVVGASIPAKIAPRRAGDPAQLVASSDKAKSILGWKPSRYNIHTILSDAWSWHKAHPHGYEA